MRKTNDPKLRQQVLIPTICLPAPKGGTDARLPREGGGDLVVLVGVFFGESLDEAEAAADHHVAVRGGEVRVEAAAAQLAALGAGNGDD